MCKCKWRQTPILVKSMNNTRFISNLTQFQCLKAHIIMLKYIKDKNNIF